MQQMLLFALLMSGLTIGVIKRPPVALAGIFCLFAFKQWAQGTMVFFVQNGTIPNLCMGALVLLGLTVKMFRGERILSPFPGVAWMVLLLFSYAALSMFWAPNPGQSAKLMLAELPYILTVIVLGPMLISEPKDVHTVAVGTIVFGCVVAVLLLLQVSWFNRMVVMAGASRDADGGNPLAVAQLGGYLALAATLLQFRNKNVLNWLLRIALAGLGILLIVKSGSRGQFLSLLPVLLIFLPMRQRVDNPGTLFAIVAFICTVLALALWEQQSGFTSDAIATQRWSSGKMLLDMTGRFRNLGILLNLWSSGSMGTLLFGLGNSAAFSIPQLGIYPHFVPGEVLAEEGVVGAFLYLMILLSAAQIVRKCFALVKNQGEARGDLAVMSAIMAFEFLLTLKQGNLIGGYIFFGIIIVLGRLRRMHEEQATTAPEDEDAVPCETVQKTG